MFATSKSDLFCRTRQRHGHIGPAPEQFRTVAGGCCTSSEHTLNTQAPTMKRESMLRMWKNMDNPTKTILTLDKRPVAFKATHSKGDPLEVTLLARTGPI